MVVHLEPSDDIFFKLLNSCLPGGTIISFVTFRCHNLLSTILSQNSMVLSLKPIKRRWNQTQTQLGVKCVSFIITWEFSSGRTERRLAFTVPFSLMKQSQYPACSAASSGSKLSFQSKQLADFISPFLARNVPWSYQQPLLPLSPLTFTVLCWLSPSFNWFTPLLPFKTWGLFAEFPGLPSPLSLQYDPPPNSSSCANLSELNPSLIRGMDSQNCKVETLGGVFSSFEKPAARKKKTLVTKFSDQEHTSLATGCSSKWLMQSVATGALRSLFN